MHICKTLFVTITLKKIYFTVTNDLTYDQRMHRICNSLVEAGYSVTLVGRELSSSHLLNKEKYYQKRIRCWFNKGKLFYAEYNTRLFLYLLFKKMDAICAIDLDTILPCLIISKIKRIPRIYDAHELFTEMKEVISRPGIHRLWLQIERKCVPKFKLGYTVSDGICNELNKRYSVEYQTIRNLPSLAKIDKEIKTDRFLLYQGAVNEARGFEQLIPAMKKINCRLVICGDGNFMKQLKILIAENNVGNKIELKGMLRPEELLNIGYKAYIGIHVPEMDGLNQYLALPNKFFEYIHAGLPQVTVGYPEYKKLNDEWNVAVLLERPTAERIADAVNNLLENDVLHNKLKENCMKARESLNWEHEQVKLISFYQKVLFA